MIEKFFPTLEGCCKGWRKAWRAWIMLTLMLGMGAIAQAQSCWDTGGSLTMSFGMVNLGSSASTTGAASFTCQSNGANTTFRACLYVSEGPGGAGTDMSGVNPRNMINYNGGSLPYVLYSDPGHTQVLGPQGGGYAVYEKVVTVPGGWNTAPLVFPVYGRVGPVVSSTKSGTYQAQFNGGLLVYSLAHNGMPSSCTQKAATANKFFMTTAGVSNSCVVGVSATDLNFGSVSSLAGPIDGTSTITMSCPPNTQWTLGLNQGLNAVGAQRRMAGPGGGFVNYDLYRDPGRTQVWDSVSNVVTGSGSYPSSVTVYGRVPAQQGARPGAYSDTVTVTLTY